MDNIEDFFHETWHSLTLHFYAAKYYLTHLFRHSYHHWDSLEWLLLCMALFMPLAFFFPNKKGQPYFRRDMITDGIYWFFGPVIYGPMFQVIMSFLASLFAIKYIQLHWELSSLPILLQAFLILLLTDFLQYWMHRAFHGSALWKFHAIHHSSKHVDWMSSARFHPVNIVIYSISINALVSSLGFGIDAFLILLPFNAIYSPLVHANLNWNYGPFKHVLASPVFHRWHHTHPDEGGNKNFAPTFPFIDVIFGTFYMPEGKKPENFGTPHDPITGNIFQQLAYPFKISPHATPTSNTLENKV